MLLLALLTVPFATMGQSYQTLPYSMGFEGLSTGSQPEGWTAIQTGVNGSTTFPCAYSYSGNTHSGSVYYEFESDPSSSDTEIVALPYMQNISSLKLDFWVSASSSYSCSLEVGVLEDDSTFTSLQTLSLTTFSGGNGWASNYHEYIVYTANYTGSGERLAFRAIRTGSGQFTLFLDDLTVSEFSGCYPLSNLVSTDIDASSISIEWTDDMNTSATYTVRYTLVGSDDTTEVSNLTATAYMATDLEPMSEYWFEVTANCSDGDALPLTASYSTGCDGTTCDFTFNLTDSWGDGWNGNSIRIYQAGGEVASVTISSGSSNVETVEVCSSAPVVLIFNKGSYADEMGGTIMDGGNTVVFNISGMNNRSTGDTLAVVNAPCPTCFPPTALTTGTTTDEITLSWTPRSESTDYVIYLNGNAMPVTVTDTFYTFTGLDANTVYTVGVQAVCSIDDSSSIATTTARTACADPSCDLTLVSAGSYSGAYYCPTLNLYQNDELLASVVSNTRVIEVCSSDPLIVTITPPTSSYYVSSATATVLDGGELVLFNGSVSGYSAGDTLLTITTPCPSCIPPTALTAVAEETQIELSWTPRSEADSYVMYLDGVALDDVVTDTSYVFTNLTGNTSYTLGVRAVCDVDDTSNIASITKRTACSVITLPKTIDWEDIEYNGAWPSCWERLVAYGTDPSVNNVSNHTTDGTYSMYLQAYYGSYNMFAMTNALPMEENHVNITFWLRLRNNGGWLQAGVMSDLNDTASFVPMLSITDMNDTWTEYEFNTSTLGTDTAWFLAFKGYSSASYGAFGYLDDIELNVYTECVRPISAMVDSSTTTEAYLHWDATEAGNYEVAYATQNNVDSATSFFVSDTNATISGLASLTKYWAWVRSICSDGNASAWRDAGVFATLCDNEGCEAIVEAVDNNGYGWYYNNYVGAYQNDILVGQASGEGTHTITLCAGAPVTFVYSPADYSYYDGYVSFTIYDGGGAEVYDCSSATGLGELITLEESCPSCITPKDLTVVQVDSNHIQYTWTVDNSVLHYQVSFNGGAWTMPTYVGVYDAYGLDPDSDYTFSVRAICAVGDTSSSRSISTHTTCGWMTVPYSESFENDSVGMMPFCWYPVTIGTGGSIQVGSVPHTGSQDLALSSNNNKPVMVASQPIPLPGDSIYVSFWAKAGSYSYFAGTLEAGLMTNPLADSTFTTMVTVTNGDYARYEFNTATFNHDSTYYLAFRFTNSYSYYNADIDDINVRLDEGCMYPTNLVATPDANNPEVTVTWDNNGSVSDFVGCYSANGTTWSTPVTIYSISNTFTFTGLSYATSYEFRIGLVCGSDTLWSSVGAMTACAAVDVPYLENFYSATGELPPCWDYTNASYFHWNRWTTHAESSGDGEMMVGSNSAGEAAILPEFYAPIIKLEISFDAKVGNVSEGDGIMMGVYDNTTDVVTWLDTLQNASQSRENFVRFTYNYLNYDGMSGNRIAIGHSHNNPSDWGFAIDSIVVVELANCNPPENITVHNTMYPNTADDVYFTWTVSGDNPPNQWQLYIDTITSTVSIDSVDDSQLIVVDTNYYQIPVNYLAEGAHYRFFVRSYCNANSASAWVELQNGFSTDEFWMNNSSTFDTIIGCDFIIYDNGGPVAGYMHNSNSNLIIQAGEVGRELQLQGGFFSHGDDANTFTVYDGVGTSGEVLYQRTNTGMTETIDSVMATSTTGALTITFTSGYYAALGYELYIHCVGAATCPRPTNLNVEMTSPTTAHATWDSTGASSYRVYHRAMGASIWNMLGTTTNSVDFTALPVDTVYEFCVVGVCSATDTSTASIIRHFNTYYEEPCEPVSGVTVGNITQTSATIDWTSTGSLWEIAVVGGATINTGSKPYTLTDLTADMQYQILVRNVCNDNEGLYSDWSDTVTFTTLPEDVMYTITVNSNNDAWGVVTGGGTYAEGTTVTLTATANSGYKFVEWQDGNTDASRSITVTADANYTATFAEDNGIDNVDGNASIVLYPNPASTSVTIDLNGFDGVSLVSIIDLNGRCCGEWKVENGKVVVDVTHYVSGAYFVRVTSENASAIRKLVVK